MSRVFPEPHRDESRSASRWFSPGLVASSEVIIRTVIDPDHLQPDGKIATTAISLDDIRRRGWSVNRINFTSPRQVKRFHVRWKKRKPSVKECYVLPVSVAELRHPSPDTGFQDFVVTDDARWCDPSHAAVLASKPCGESAARVLRSRLMSRLLHYTNVDDVFRSENRWGYVRGMIRQLTSMVRSVFR